MSDDYRSFNIFLGMPSAHLRGQLTIRGDKAEAADAYAKRVLSELGMWSGLGWQVERPFYAPDAATRPNVETEPDFEPMPEPPSPAPSTPTTTAAPATGNGVSVMHIVKAVIVSDRQGLPQLEMYAAGHKFPDLRYSLGKDAETRRSNLVRLLSGLGNTPSPDAIKIGYSREVNWNVAWKQGREPKYKDVVSIGPYAA